MCDSGFERGGGGEGGGSYRRLEPSGLMPGFQLYVGVSDIGYLVGAAISTNTHLGLLGFEVLGYGVKGLWG